MNATLCNKNEKKRISSYFLLHHFDKLQPYKKELSYKGVTIATIKGHTSSGTSNDLVTTLISGSSINTSNSSMAYYTYEVNGKAYGGETSDLLFKGEKFIVKYDTIHPDNGRSRFIFYKPVLEAAEKTATTTGIIKTVFEKTSRDIIQISFQYSIPVKKSALDSIRARFDTYNYSENSVEKFSIEKMNATDSVNLCFTKFQYLPVSANVNELKQDLNKKYKVVYSADNYQRAILYVN